MSKSTGRFNGYFFSFVVTVLIVLSATGSPAFSQDFEVLEKERMTSIWVGGEILGDMVLGAEGQVILLYMDRKACRMAAEQRGSIPEWLSWNLQHEADAIREKKAFFLVRYKAMKNWHFDPEEIKIGEYSLRQEDLVTRKEFRKIGDLSPDTEGTLALLVPSKYVKPGSTVTISYGRWSENWTIPRR